MPDDIGGRPVRTRWHYLVRVLVVQERDQALLSCSIARRIHVIHSVDWCVSYTSGGTLMGAYPVSCCMRDWGPESRLAGEH